MRPNTIRSTPNPTHALCATSQSRVDNPDASPKCSYWQFAENNGQGTVGVAIASPVESVADRFAAGGFQWADPAEFGESGVAADPRGVVAEAVSSVAAVSGSDAVDSAQLGSGGGGDGVDVGFESGGFGVKLVATCRQRLDSHDHGIAWGG
jgi:hypothetical protein